MSGAFPIALPLSFETWMPLTQAATLGVLTFVQEDIPAVSAALLAAAGKLSWPVAYAGCFLGIWLGDALLYLLARSAGRPLLDSAIFRRSVKAEYVTRSENWFAKRGDWILLASRCIPGARLPTYLAAGFLKAPFGRFLLITGIAVAVWTSAIFLFAGLAGPRLLAYLSVWNSRSWTWLASVLLLLVLARSAARFTDRRFRRGFIIALLRWKHWEFWPAWLFYLPVALNYIRLAILYRGWTLPTAANPGIFSGGLVGESKIATLRDLHNTSPALTAEAWLLEGSTFDERSASLQSLLATSRLSYPFILKPDIGQRGAGVKLIRTWEQAAAYLAAVSAPLLAQRYAKGPQEAGVFYYRFPGEERGRIFAITEKVFPYVTGDGLQTIEELIWGDPRARFLANKYLARLGPAAHNVPVAGETFKLVEAGNHAQGCIFRDGTHLGSVELEQKIDEISQRLDGFYIGRYDIRYNSAEDLRRGANFQIIELNGAAAEATSIYDARNSVWSAYQTLFRQWELVFAIGAANRKLGSPPTEASRLWRKWCETNAMIKTYPSAD